MVAQQPHDKDTNSVKSLFFFGGVMSIELFNLGEDLGTVLGVTSFEGGLILTLIVCGMVLSFPLYKRMYNIAFILMMLSLSLCVGLTWLNVYVFVIIICGIAGGIAIKFREIITGRFG